MKLPCSRCAATIRFANQWIFEIPSSCASAQIATRSLTSPLHGDLVRRCFVADASDRLWLTDVHSRRIGGWSIVDHLRSELVVDALEMVRWRGPAAGVVVIAGLNTVLNAVEEEAPRAPSSNVPATPAATGSAAPAVGAFEPAAEPEFPRTFHTATLLRDGTVLVVGGCCDGSNLIGTAERYDPATDTWSRAGELVVPRQTHTATQLSDGRVVIIGGTGGGGASGILAAIEVYDPATAQFSIAGSLNTARLAHAALALPDDRVLVLGGVGLSDAPQDVELFDPVAVDAEVLGVVLPPPFQQSSAVLLDEGTVLLTGGGSAAVLDLVTHHFEELAAPEELGEWPIAAVALQSGKVLLAGGCCAGTDARPHAAVFDPATRLARPIAPMADGRLAQRMTLLADGRVLVTGGYENAGHGFGDALASAEVFDPATEAFTSTGSMSDHRGSGHTSTLLRDGSVLVVGTITQAGGRAAERYVP